MTRGSGPRETPTGSRRGKTPLVGRVRELAALQRAVHRILLENDGGSSQSLASRKRRRPGDHLCLLTGEPGVGKTRLMDEVADYASGRGILVLRGDARERGGTALSPFPRVLRELQDLPALEAAPDRAIFLDQLATAVIRASADQPVLLLLGDLHWSGPEGSDLFKILARRLREAASPLLIVASLRGAEVAGTPMEAALSDLRKDEAFRELKLGRLSSRDVGRMVEEMLGAPAAPEFLGELTEATRGNPFYVEEIVRTLAAEGRLRRTAGTWGVAGEVRLPSTIREALGRRLDGLSGEQVLLLKLAAVLDRPVPPGLLAAASGLETARYFDVLVELTRCGFLVQEGEGESLRVRFDHPLTGAVVYEGMENAERAALHGRSAAALLAYYGEGAGRRAEELAYHYHRAGEDRPTVVYSLAAAVIASRVYAHERAVGFLRTAVELCRARGRWRREHREAVRRLADTLRWIGRHEEAAATLKRALAEGVAVRPREVAELQRMLGEAMLEQGLLHEAAQQFARADQSLGEASRTQERGSERGLVRLAQGRLAMWRGHYKKALEHLEEARGLLAGPGPGPAPARVEALHLGALALHFLGRSAEAAERLSECLRESGRERPAFSEPRRTLGDSRGVLILRGPLDTAHDFSTDLAAAGTYYCEQGEAYRRVGDAEGLAFALNNLGVLAHARGDYAQALELFGRVLSIGEAAGDQRGTALALLNRGRVLNALGRAAEAEPVLERALDQAERQGSDWLAAAAQHLLGQAAALQKRWRKASTRLSAALNAFQRIGNKAAAAEVLADAARAAWERGDQEAARELAGKVLARLERLNSRVALVDSLLLAARIAWTGRDGERARAALEAASVQVDLLGLDPELWRLRALQGLLAEESGDMDEAIALYRRALPPFRRLLDRVPPDSMESFLAVRGRGFYTDRIKSFSQ